MRASVHIFSSPEPKAHKDSGFPRVREKWNFAKVREMSGNFDECQGNLKNKAKVREMSGNFEQTVREFSSIGI